MGKIKKRKVSTRAALKKWVEENCAGRRYGRGVPRKIPEGRVLAHNTVVHGREWPSGPEGFRWWTWPEDKKPEHFVPCQCGWTDLPHYAQSEHAESFKCETFKPRGGWEQAVG